MQDSSCVIGDDKTLTRLCQEGLDKFIASSITTSANLKPSYSFFETSFVLDGVEQRDYGDEEAGGDDQQLGDESDLEESLMEGMNLALSDDDDDSRDDRE